MLELSIRRVGRITTGGITGSVSGIGGTITDSIHIAHI
jgi:hypothetical protein